MYANRALLSALGYLPGKDPLPQKVRDLFAPGDGPPAAPSGKDSREPKDSRLLRLDGTVVSLQVENLGPIPSAGPGTTVFVLRDASERRRMQARLLLADRMASMGTVAAGVAHEINNPLAYIIANLGFAAVELPRLRDDLARAENERAHELEDVIEAIREARQGAQRLRTIVRNLKTFSRSDEEKRERVDIREVLESAINLSWNEIRHRARLVKDFGKTPLVEANEARLGQVCLNLIVNGAQSMPEGKANENELRIVTYTNPVGDAVIEVRDTGVGIAAENVERIFDPFFTTKPVGIGTGLGLSICHGIVTALGGEIGVESRVGEGSVFRVTLPSAPITGLQEIPVPSQMPTADGPARRVLVIDDDNGIGRALRRILRGHDVTVVTSGREALDILQSDASFHVIFCDVMMPDLSGMEVYDRLHSSDPTVADRIVFMTGGAFTDRAREFLEAVPNARIEKPFDPAVVLEVLRSPNRRV